MTKSDLIDKIAAQRRFLTTKEVDAAVSTMLAHVGETLAQGDRVEIRGFGSFSLHFRKARVGRNPKTGEAVSLDSKHVPHFKPGKELRERVNGGLVGGLVEGGQRAAKGSRS